MIAVLLIIIAGAMPKNNGYINNLSCVATIASAVAAFFAWINTREMIEKRKLSKLKIEKGDIIVGVDLLRRETNIENIIKKSAEGIKLTGSLGYRILNLVLA